MKRPMMPRIRWARAAVAVMVAMLAFMLSQGVGVRADPGFNPTADVSLSDYSTSANADVIFDFSIPEGDVNFETQVTFIPGDPDDPSGGFFVAPGGAIPDGTVVGEHEMVVTLGLLNGPCYTALPLDFTLLDASLDTMDTCTFQEQFLDTNTNGIPDGAEKYPDFLNTMFPGMTPWARMFGGVFVAGATVSINVVVFAPGDMAGFPADWGYPSVTILNFKDPTAPAPGAMTDFCTPLESETTTLGLADGLPYRANPCGPGTYTARSYAQGLPDADGDGYENDLDTCPYDVNEGDPRILGSGDPDFDGIDNVCDPDPATACWPGAPGVPGDCDDDGYMNRGDNCPLVANAGQEDADGDGIGDVCDTDGIAPKPEVTIELDVEITGPDLCVPTCAGLPATIVGTDGRDILIGTRGPDVIAAGAGTDLILGRGGDDVICAGAGRDVVIAGRGNDTVFGEEGRDILLGGPGNDSLDGGAGFDICLGGRGSDTATYCERP